MKRHKDLRENLKKITFRTVLTITMAATVCAAFLIFSLIIAGLSERKIRENVRDNMSIVAEQFDVYLNNYLGNIDKGFKALESDGSLLQLRLSAQNEKSLAYTAASYVSVKKFLDQFVNANSTSVYNVYINFNDGKITTQAYQQNLLKISYSYGAWKERFPENRYYWVDADYCRDLIPDPAVGAMLFHLYEDRSRGQNGIILIAIPRDFFETVLDASALDENACISLVTDYGRMSFGDEKAGMDVGRRMEKLSLKAAAAAGIHSEVLGDYFFVYKKMPLTGWSLVYNVKESSISNAHFIWRDIMFITGFGIVVVALVISMLSKAVSHSLCVLTKQVEAEDVLDHEISLHSYAEITSLSNGLEEMRRRIKGLLHQVEMEQEAKTQMEIALMQEQINPHFLYNTLYACIQLCEMKQPEKASKMLTALSVFYRIGLNGGNYMISVEEELRHVKNYLFIQHFRYSDVFDYTIDCDPEILRCRIPKMSLQPLVENAIYHGVKKKHGVGNICIIGGVDNREYAYIEVHDDGLGMTRKQVEEIQAELEEKGWAENQTGFGMKNVNARIKFAFGPDSGLSVSSVPNDTCVRICFRMQEMKQEEEKEKERQLDDGDRGGAD